MYRYINHSKAFPTREKKVELLEKSFVFHGFEFQVALVPPAEALRFFPCRRGLGVMGLVP